MKVRISSEVLREELSKHLDYETTSRVMYALPDILTLEEMDKTECACNGLMKDPDTVHTDNHCSVYPPKPIEKLDTEGWWTTIRVIQNKINELVEAWNNKL